MILPIRVRSFCKHVGLGFCVAILPQVADARGVSPYLPLNLSPEIERQIERVLILADKPVLTRPIAAATVLDALPKACKKDVVLCENVRRYLNTYMRRAAITHASIEGAAAKSSSTTIPNSHGMPFDSKWQASVSGFYQPSDYALLNVGGLAYDGEPKATGSFLSLG